MMTTVKELNNDETKVPDKFIFRSVSPVLLPNSMSKLIRNRCACKLIIKTTAAYVYANEQFPLCFYVLVRYSVVLFVQLWKLY